MSRTGTIGWRCRQCGNLNGLEAKFCRSCGAPASEGTPVDTSQRNTQSYQMPGSAPAQMSGAAASTRVPRNIEVKKSNKVWKIVIIVLCALLALALITFGVYKLLKSKLTDDTPISDGNQTQNEEVTDLDLMDEPTETEPAPETQPQDEPANTDTPSTDSQQDSYYVAGGEYTVLPKIGVRVRSRPDAEDDNNRLLKSQVPSEYQSSLENGEYAVLKQGSKVKCVKMNESGDWMMIAEGCWVCVVYKDEVLIK